MSPLRVAFEHRRSDQSFEVEQNLSYGEAKPFLSFLQLRIDPSLSCRSSLYKRWRILNLWREEVNQNWKISRWQGKCWVRWSWSNGPYAVTYETNFCHTVSLTVLKVLLMIILARSSSTVDCVWIRVPIIFTRRVARYRSWTHLSSWVAEQVIDSVCGCLFPRGAL